jgi:hypothetical protein
MLERDQFTWRGMLLTLRGKAVANIVPSEVQGMYRIAWPNGDISPDHYNLPRAKQNAITGELRRMNGAAQDGRETPSEAPPFVLLTNPHPKGCMTDQLAAVETAPQ